MPKELKKELKKSNPKHEVTERKVSAAELVPVASISVYLHGQHNVTSVLFTDMDEAQKQFRNLSNWIDRPGRSEWYTIHSPTMTFSIESGSVQAFSLITLRENSHLLTNNQKYVNSLMATPLP